MQTPGYAPGGFELVTIRPGMRGLVVGLPGAVLPPDAAVQLDNWRIDLAGRLRGRPGAQLLFQSPAVGTVHTLARLYQPTTGTYVAFVGVGTVLFRGPDPSSLAPVSTVLSGNPLICVPHRPAISGDPWMIVADTNVLGQIPATGEAMLLGLPAPTAGLTSRIVDVLRTTICAFDGTTGASAWTGTPGQDTSDTPVTAGAPVITDVTGITGTCVEFTTNPGNTTTGYYTTFGAPATSDLTQLQSGFRPAEPEDLINLWVRVSRPGIVEEIRVYLVCASGFNATIVPGQHPTLNTDAFVHTLRPSDITGFLENQQSSADAAEQTQQAQVIDDYLRLPQQRNPEDPDDRSGRIPDEDSGRVTQPTVRIPTTMAPGRNVWTQFGVRGKPLRRSDFERIGTTEGRGWDTITGVVIVVKTTTNEAVAVACEDWYLHGGYRLDSTEIGAQGYDYRYTHYHLDTGDEGNPSAIQAESTYLYPARQRIAIQPTAAYTGAGSARVRQRFYRRGGTLTSDWYYIGQNTANGAEFVDTLSDLEIAAAATLEIDNYQPVPTVDATGTLVLASVLPAVWGPLDGAIYGCGDRYRPGHLYRSKTGKPGSWPPDLVVEVCSPSEELLNGFVYGGQGFVFSRRRLFVISPNLAAGGAPTVQDTPCQKGLAGRWAFAVGPEGCTFVSDDGIYDTTGGPARPIAEDLRALWQGQSSAGAVAIDLSAETALRVFTGKGLIYVQYQGLDGVRYQLVGTRRGGDVVWTRDLYADPVASVYVDPENPELPPYLGSASTGRVFQLTGVYDGTSTPVVSRYHSPEIVFQRPREEKQAGDLILESAYIPAGALQVTPVYDSVDVGTVLSAGGGAASVAHRDLLTFEAGADRRFQALRFQAVLTTPITNSQPGEIWQMQITAAPLAEETARRLGQWEPLGTTGAFLTGVAITCDTTINNVESGSGSKLVHIEYTRGATTGTLGPYTLTAAGRRTIYLSWAGVIADQVRIVPQDDAPWLLYALQWQATDEPPGVNVWDSGEQVLGDVYYTGLDLVVRGGGVASIYVDNVLVATKDFRTSAPVNGVPNDTDKTYLHLSFGPGYGHIFRCQISAAPNAVQVYTHKWIVEPVPGEQMNWNRNFELAGTLTEKLVKGVLLECDTNNNPKTVQVQADGTVVQTLTVQANGRSVLHLSFPQFRARVLRLLPTDNIFLSRLWSVQWIFDEEPLALSRWETQLLTHRQPGWHSVYEVTVGYRAAALVTLTVQGFNEHGAQIFEDTYPLPAASERQRVVVPFEARLAVYWKYLFTSAQAFSLYREDSQIAVLPFTGEQQVFPAVFGNDDLDHGRAMGSASGIAATPNNGGMA